MPHFGANQLAFHIITNANQYLATNNDVDLIVFVSNQVKPWQHPTFATMNINEAFDFKGFLVATNISTAGKLLGFPGAIRRYFYVWDLEWMRKTGESYEYLAGIYNNPKLTLIARHENHADIISKCWNRPVKSIIPNGDVAAFINMIRTDEQNRNLL